MTGPRVLLMANDCNPEWPSLPVVGYNLCRALARQADVVVATHIRNKPALERQPIGAPTVFIDNEYVAAPLYQLCQRLRGGASVAWTINIAMLYPSLLCFEHEVWKRFGSSLLKGRFDLVHRVTPMSPTLPSPMASWSPVPFVLGPLNGGLRWPKGFHSELAREREWLTYARGAHKLAAYYQSTYRKAAAVLAAFDHTIADLPRSARFRAIDFPEVGVDPALFGASKRDGGDGPLRFLFAGRLVPYKCADVVVEAFGRSRSLRRHRLLIVGDGPERPRLESIVQKYGLGDAVEFLGRKTQAGVGAIMRESDVFVFPSIRELGAGVVVEAMASGLPCIVVDYGGPGGLIEAERGVKVALGTKEQIVERTLAEMEALADDGSRRKLLGCNARDYAIVNLGWDAKATKVLEVYDRVLKRRLEAPEHKKAA